MVKYIVLFLLNLFFLTGFGQEIEHIKIGVKHEPPFVIKGNNKIYTGLSVDLWKEIANQRGATFEFIEYNDHLALIRALDFGEIDLSINPIHVNEMRMKLLDVTQPFFVSSIGVATSQTAKNQLGIFIQNFFSLQFLKMIVFMLIIIWIFGIFLWLVEKKHNRHQFRPNLLGIFDGLWWSTVTMTTVGYGDKAPKTKLGRIIAMIWMFTAIVIIAGFTATIASTLTVNTLSRNIEDLEDLRNTKNIGSVFASSSEDYLKRNEITIEMLYDDVQISLLSLSARNIEALVYDRTVLDYFISKLQLSNKVSLLPVSFNKQYRSFLLPKDSQHLAWINPILVRKINEPSWQGLLNEYNLQMEN